MLWSIELLDERVEAEIAALPRDCQARFVWIADLIEAYGFPAVGMPYVRHLEGKLWEMRLKGRDGIARAIYVTASGRRVVVVHAFVKKAQKAPAKALKIARTRAKEVT